MRAEEILGQVRDTLTVRQVFGEPYERDDEGGSGGGFVLEARPVGVYVIRDGEVSWRPAVDVTRIALGGQLVAVVALLVARSVIRRLARR